MQVSSVYPVLMTNDVAGLSSFYREYFGFETSFEADWYVSLKTEGDGHYFQLAVVQEGHPSIPAGFSRPVAGLILNIEVDDARSEYERLVVSRRLSVKLDIRDEPWGQRHFMVADPSANLVDVIQIIPPTAEFLAQYTDGVQ